MKHLIIEIQHYSWHKRDEKWYEISRYLDNEEGLKNAKADLIYFPRTYGKEEIREEIFEEIKLKRMVVVESRPTRMRKVDVKENI